MTNIKLPLIVAAVLFLHTGVAMAVKDSPTWYTPERVAHARRNVEQFEWARTRLAAIKAGQGFKYYTGADFGPADVYAEKDDQFMWDFMPTTAIGRFVPHEFKSQCPDCGVKLREVDPYGGYTIDPINHPFQVNCKRCHRWFPDEEYPDDGSGCEANGTTYYFMREYAHLVYGSGVVPGLASLSQAYLITGDERYARAGCVLLAKLAFEYPNHTTRRDRLYYANYDFHDPDVSWKMGGMITDLIWENKQLEKTALAYDGLFSYMDQDPEMIAFLKSKGMPIENGDDLRRYIEDNILRSGLEGLFMGNIHGNDGMHQAAALAVAVVLDDYDDSEDNPHNSKAAVDYMVHYQHAQWSHVAHDALMMINGTDRSGGGHESPNYSCSRFNMVDTNQYMDQIRSLRPDMFPADQYPDLFDMPKIDRIYDFYLKCSIHGYFTPNIGDCGGISNPARVDYYAWAALPHGYDINYLYAFQKYGDPRYARACTNIETGELATGELFAEYPAERIAAAMELPESNIEWTTRLLDGYGLAILDSAETFEHRRAIALNYTNLLGHYQCDALSVHMFSRGVSMLPDLGYPKGWEYRYTWDSNSLAHNTVTVDETQHRLSPYGGKAMLFGSRDGVHVVSAMHNPYPDGKLPDGAKDNSLYQRTVIMIDIDDENYYIVDHFAVDGGTQHDQSWHGMLTPVVAPELAWDARPGTLAGENVAQFGKWTDRWGRERDDFPAFLTNIRTAALSQPAVWQWNSGLEEGDALRMHIIPVDGPMQIIAGGGRSPNRTPDWNLDYVIARRMVSDGAPSQFVTVLDGYQNNPVVQSVKLISSQPMVLEVTHAGGTDTITVDVPLQANRFDRPQATSVRVASPRGEVSMGERYTQSQIRALDYDADRIAVAYSAEAEKAFVPGADIRVYNDGRSAIYRVTAVERDRGSLWLTLNETAVYARAKVRDHGDGVIHLDSHLTYANGVTENGNFFAGAWIGEDSAAIQLTGATKGENNNLLVLAKPVRGAILRRRFPDDVITVWQYGIGDKVEVAHVVAE
jgi:hypothetical protein